MKFLTKGKRIAKTKKRAVPKELLSKSCAQAKLGSPSGRAKKPIQICSSISALLQLLALLHPQRADGIRRHAPVSARGQRNRTDLRAVRQTRTLKLLDKEPANKRRQPFLNCRIVIDAGERMLCQTIDLLRLHAKSQQIIQIEIVQLIRADQFFCLLRNLSVLWRQ